MQPPSSSRLVVALIAGCVSACGGGSSEPTDRSIEGLVSLELTPANESLVIAGTAPAVETYRATGTFADGHREDLTDRAVFSSKDVTLGSFNANVFTSTITRGGFATILATAGGKAGATNLSLKLARSATSSSSIPENPASRFSGTLDASRAPALVYPNDGVLLPPNLRQLEFHLLPGPGNTLFELSFENEYTDVKVYADCAQPLNGGCIYLPSAEVWQWIAETNRGGRPLIVGLRATDGTGKSYGSSAPLSISFSLDDLIGGIYYWTTSGQTAIMRFDFASATQTVAEKLVGAESTGGNCVGCHALSHAGAKLIAAGGTPHRGQLLLMDVGRSQPIVPWGTAAGRSLFESWSPDDSQFVGVWGELDAQNFNLLLFDGQTTALRGSIDVGGTALHPVTHPDWSPDGSSIAFTRVGDVRTDASGHPRIQEIYRGAIEVVTRSGNGWSQPAVVVPAAAGKNHYYPAFAPDGSFLVYDESTCPNGSNGDSCDSDSDPSAHLWAVGAAAGSKPVELARANAPGAADGRATNLTNSYPRWSPFSFKLASETPSALNWISFSSRRSYGLRKPPPSSDGSGTSGLLIWMAGVDPMKAKDGVDPSYPAFALPFQNMGTSNHLAQWTTRVVPTIQ